MKTFMYTQKTGAESIREYCKNLGIPEYVEGLTDREILDLAFFHFRDWLRDNHETLFENIHEGESK